MQGGALRIANGVMPNQLSRRMNNRRARAGPWNLLRCTDAKPTATLRIPPSPRAARAPAAILRATLFAGRAHARLAQPVAIEQAQEMNAIETRRAGGRGEIAAMAR